MRKRMMCVAVVMVLVLGLAGTVTAGLYSEAVLADGPVAYWRLNEASGPTAYDATLNSLDGNYAASPLFQQAGPSLSGLSGDEAVGFDSAGPGFVYVGDNNALDITGAITISAWINVTDYPEGFFPIVSKRPGKGTGTDHINYLFTIKADGSVWFVYRGSDSAAYVLSSQEGVIFKDTWYHVAVSHTFGSDATGNALFVDGEPLSGCFWYSAPSGVGAVANSETLKLGRDYTSTGDPARYANGLLDEVAIFDSALGAEGIQRHYQAALGAVPEPTALGVICLALLGLRKKRN